MPTNKQLKYWNSMKGKPSGSKGKKWSVESIENSLGCKFLRIEV